MLSKVKNRTFCLQANAYFYKQQQKGLSCGHSVNPYSENSNIAPFVEQPTITDLKRIVTEASNHYSESNQRTSKRNTR